jgi:LPXTG-motif cell wall-anchored protein
MKHYSHKIVKVGSTFLATAMVLGSATPAFAATTLDADVKTQSVAVNDALEQTTATDYESAINKFYNNGGTTTDIIATNKTGSLSIYKYDITSATLANAYVEGTLKATGEANTTLQSTLSDYAIEGVEFTYLRVGNVETHSVESATGRSIELVYEIDNDLRDILQLSTDDAVDMTRKTNEYGSTEAWYCNNQADKSLYHYTSQQISDALSAALTADEVGTKNRLEAYITDTDSKVHSAGTKMQLTDSNGYTTVDGLQLGLYLIVETRVPEEVTDTVNPWFVQLPMTNTSYEHTNDTGDEASTSYDKNSTTGGNEWLYDVTCYPKNQTGNPTLDKLVRNATGTVSLKYQNKEESEKKISAYEDNSYLVYNKSANTSGSTLSLLDDASFVSARGGDVNGANAGINYTTTVGEYTYNSTTTASEGDILDYILVSKIPHVSSTATYLSEYTFTDVLGEGIEYLHDAHIAFYTSEADAMVNNTNNAVLVWNCHNNKLTANGDTSNGDDTIYYAEKYVTVTESKNHNTQLTGQTSLTISFTDKGLALINGDNSKYTNNALSSATSKIEGTNDRYASLQSLSDLYMVVYYQCKVNSDATAVLGDDGNVNDVQLVWSRSNSSTYSTLEDRCYVYTYGIDLTKDFSDAQGDPTKVKFVLYNVTDGYYVTAAADNVNNVDGYKVYYVTGKVTDQSDATIFTPTQLTKASDTNTMAEGQSNIGHFIINGLEGDTYELIEIETDDGYSLLKDPITIVINSASRSITSAKAGTVGNVYGQVTGTIVGTTDSNSALAQSSANTTFAGGTTTTITSSEAGNSVVHKHVKGTITVNSTGEETSHTGCYSFVLTCSKTEQSSGALTDSAALAHAHIHDASCYTITDTLDCGFSIGDPYHGHTASCYDSFGNLTCTQTKENHGHTKDCYILDDGGERVSRTVVAYATDSNGNTVETTRVEYEVNCGYAVYNTEHTTHTADCYDDAGKLTCGLDTIANGRTINKTEMVVGTLNESSASVDGIKANMANYTLTDTTYVDGTTLFDWAEKKTPVVSACCVYGTGTCAQSKADDIDSENAKVVIAITNSKSFLLPRTGGNGLYAVTIAGVLAVAAGCFFVMKKSKKA